MEANKETIEGLASILKQTLHPTTRKQGNMPESV